MTQPTKQSGFTAVELLITLFVAAAFLIAAYQLFNLVIKDGGNTRAESRASNIAYDYMRQYAASSTTIPCTPSIPLSSAPVSVDGLSDATITVTVTCPPSAISSLSKVEVALSYNKPLQTVKYATFVSSSGSTGTRDITNGLVGWWKLNNSLTDTSPANNGGSGSVSYGQGQNNVASNALLLNGSQYAQLPAATNIQYPLSISAWVYPTSLTSSGTEGPYVLAADPGARLRITSAGYPAGTIRIDNSWSSDLISSIPVQLNQWSHLVITFDGTNARIYVNGTLGGTSAASGSTVTYNSATPYVIGSDNYVTNAYHGNFYGKIDDVRLFARTLPLTDIVSLYSAGAK